MRANLKYDQKKYHQIPMQLLKVIKIPAHKDYQNIWQPPCVCLLPHPHRLLLKEIQSKAQAFCVPSSQCL